jgi:hypothetical protein
MSHIGTELVIQAQNIVDISSDGRFSNSEAQLDNFAYCISKNRLISSDGLRSPTTNTISNEQDFRGSHVVIGPGLLGVVTVFTHQPRTPHPINRG